MKNVICFFVILSFPLVIVCQNLEVEGAIKINDGTQGVDKVLTSDANGLASWKSAPPPSSGTYYQSVGICCQKWMTKNLDVDTYRNGDVIPKVEDPIEWAGLTTGAYCYYNNDSTSYAAIYGKLYNWFAVNDPRGLAPEGWHIPTDFEWTNSMDCLGGGSVAGGKMKELGTTHWTTPNTGATNVSGFTGLPGGERAYDGEWFSIGTAGSWWSSTETNTVSAYFRSMFHINDNGDRLFGDKNSAYSVRCVKD